MTFDGPLLNDRWRLGPRMGSGAQARTYLARDEQAPGERVVIVKQLELQKQGSSWKNFDLFEREVRVLKSLRHPGIPRFIESFESQPGVFCLVIEKMPGASLRAIATRVTFSDADLHDILIRVLDILVYLHEHDPPVIHRDIKPANLVRDAQGAIALVDFGGVRDAIRDRGGSTVVGTFGYMAPEQLHGQATPATDIYGLGATIVALAGGIEPEDVPRKGLRMDLHAHLSGRAPDLIELLEAMTEPDPEQRPQSARQVLERVGRRGKRAARTASPVADRQALEKLESDTARTAFDEVGDMLAEVPEPLAAVLRVLILGFSVLGYVGLAVLQAVLLPVLFALVGMMVKDSTKPTLKAIRNDVGNALDEGKDGFRQLQKRCLPGGKKRKRLPE